jgi:hypothetical protein
MADWLAYQKVRLYTLGRDNVLAPCFVAATRQLQIWEGH